MASHLVERKEYCSVERKDRQTVEQMVGTMVERLALCWAELKVVLKDSSRAEHWACHLADSSAETRVGVTVDLWAAELVVWTAGKLVVLLVAWKVVPLVVYWVVPLAVWLVVETVV